jgi:hypothetical protein
MGDMTPECQTLSGKLHEAALKLSRSSDEGAWTDVEAAARELANALRVKTGPGQDACTRRITCD